MEKKKAPVAYGVLLAALTLVPSAGARWPSILGYRAHCTFAPISTAVCALLAACTCVVRTRWCGVPRRRSPVAPIVVGAALLAVIAVSAPFQSRRGQRRHGQARRAVALRAAG